MKQQKTTLRKNPVATMAAALMLAGSPALAQPRQPTPPMDPAATDPLGLDVATSRVICLWSRFAHPKPGDPRLEIFKLCHPGMKMSAQQKRNAAMANGLGALSGITTRGFGYGGAPFEP